MTSTLQFDETTHTYTVDGQSLPSITTVIEACGLVDYSMLSQEDLAFYQDRGTALHQATWFLDEGDLDEDGVDKDTLPRLKAWRKFRRDLTFRTLLIEKRMYDPIYGFAGTPDRVVEFPDGRRGVIELKTGAIQKAVALQTAAQVKLVREKNETTLRRLAVHLKADGEYSVREFHTRDYPADLSVFLSALSVYKWRKANALMS